MEDKNIIIEQILKDIYALPAPILEKSRKEQISNILNVAINGDSIVKFLVSDVTIAGDLEVFVYIITNKRFILAVINRDGKVNTYPFIIKEIENISFNSPKPNMMSVELNLLGGRLLGLNYSSDKEKITSFFQALDQILLLNGR